MCADKIQRKSCLTEIKDKNGDDPKLSETRAKQKQEVIVRDCLCV